MAINEELQLGRAKNAVLTFLEQRLSIPKIYLDADWAESHVDVLAINRDGFGDVHAVLLFPNRPTFRPDSIMADLSEAISPLLSRLQGIPAQYKYIGAVDVSPEGKDALPGVPHTLVEKSFSPDGIGRIGFLAIESFADREPEVRTVFKPERFRAKISKLVEDYLHQHEADWEIRA